MKYYGVNILETILKLPTPASVEVAYDEACAKFGADRVMLINEYEYDKSDFLDKFESALLNIQNSADIPNYHERVHSYRNYWTQRDFLLRRIQHLLFWRLIIHFPVVTVRNEYGESIDIYDLFACIYFTMTGTPLHISYCRTTYTQAQLDAGYCHSHTPRIYDFSSVKTFNSVCLGIGPIGHTLSSLAYTLSRVAFKIFFIQLDTIVHSESLTGGPYIKLSSVGTKWEPPVIVPQKPVLGSTEAKRAVKDCIESYLNSGRLHLAFADGKFKLACTFDEWLIDFSDYVHKWLNVIPEDEYSFPYASLFVLTAINNNTIVFKSGTGATRNMSNKVGEHILTFNGTSYNFKIVPNSNEPEIRKIKLFRSDFGLYIIQQILKTVNYYYEQEPKKEYEQRTEFAEDYHKGNCTPGAHASDTAYIV